MKCSQVPADQVDAVWPDVERMMASATAVTNGRYTTADVRQALRWDHMQLWIAFDASGIEGVQVTQITYYPSRTVLTSLFTAGHRIRRWREPMMELLSRFAAETGCSLIEGQGRAGWIKLMQPYGCRLTQTLFEKDVDHGR